MGVWELIETDIDDVAIWDDCLMPMQKPGGNGVRARILMSDAVFGFEFFVDQELKLVGLTNTNNIERSYVSGRKGEGMEL